MDWAFKYEIQKIMTVHGCVVVFVGLPGAGKTMICKQLIDELKGNRGPTRPVHVSYDRLVDYSGLLLDQSQDNFKVF